VEGTAAAHSAPSLFASFGDHRHLPGERLYHNHRGRQSPYNNQSDPWILPSDLFVGQNRNAGILVSRGSQVKDVTSPSQYDTFIAADPNVTASVTVSGRIQCGKRTSLSETMAMGR